MYIVFLWATILSDECGIKMSLQVRLQDQGAVLDFDATDLQRQPPLDTTWHQVHGLPLCIHENKDYSGIDVYHYKFYSFLRHTCRPFCGYLVPQILGQNLFC